MRRREFIAGLGSVVAWPPATDAQQKLPVIGFLHANSAATAGFSLSAFRQGLSEVGYREGSNVDIEFRWAEGHYERLPVLAAELVQRHVSVIFATGGTASVFAAKAASSAIPIVFLAAVDPIAAGLVSSLNRPGGNLTGISGLNTALAAKRLQMLHELVPAATTIALLVNPTSPTTEKETSEAQAAARIFGLSMLILNVDDPREFDKAFAILHEQRAGALVVSSDTFFTNSRKQLVAMAARYAVPAIYQYREFIAEGGLMSYGASLPDLYRLGAIYVGRVLNGEKPADLPVQQATKIELVINLKTAKALGLTFPTALLVRADEVIE